MSYRTRWTRRAFAETKQFWSTKRIVAAVLASPVAGVLWAIFKPWIGWIALMQFAVISILGVLVSWCVAFVWCFFEAPSQLELDKSVGHEKETARLASLQQKAESALANKTDQLKELIAQKYPHDEHRERLVSGALVRLCDRDQAFLRWLLDAGRVSRGRVQMQQFGDLLDNINQRAGLDFITDEPVRSANGTEIDRYHQINPTLLLALKNLFHPLPPQA